MSKIPLKKIIINKTNSSRIIEKKKPFLKSPQIGNKYINEDYYNMNKSYLNSQDNSYGNNLVYDVENKENYNIQNSKLKRINQIKDLNYYLIQKRKTNSNNNEFNIKAFQKKDMSNEFKNYQSNNHNFLYSKYIENNHNNNIELSRNNKIFNEMNNDGYFTSRIPVNNINKQIIKNRNSNRMLKNNSLTERVNNTNDNLKIYLDNHFFLPENKSGKKTLILDLDETLIHSSLKPFNMKNEVAIKIINKGPNNKLNKDNKNNEYIIHMLKRPYVGIFLSIVCDIFEVVIFTASIQDYANSILDEIDTEKKIKYRLYRDHCITIDKDRYIKNLYCLGRDLKNVIIIDNNPFSYSLNMENGLPISTWETNQSDNELIKLIPLLQYLSKREISDVRPILKKIVVNHRINYDEINKLINYKNKIFNTSFRENGKNIINNKQNNIFKEINNKNQIKTILQKKDKYRNSLNNKIKLNDSNKNNINNNSSILSSQKILKNIFFNKENELFLKQLKTKNINSQRGKSENQKQNNLENSDKKKNNEYFSSQNPKLNLSAKYLLNKSYLNNISERFRNNSNEGKNQNTDSIPKIKSKIRMFNSMIANKRKDINNSIPNSYKISRNKKFVRNKNIIYLKKNEYTSKSLVKNNSDYRYNINPNKSKIANRDDFKNSKFPTLKTLFFNKIFSNNTCKFRNKNNNNLSALSNKNEVFLTESQSQKQIGFKFLKHNNNIEENNKVQNNSLNNFLNNKLNLKILDDNLNNFIIRLKMKNPKNQSNESKIRNKSLIVSKNNNINSDTNKDLKGQLIKHSFSFLYNKNKIK